LDHHPFSVSVPSLPDSILPLLSFLPVLYNLTRSVVVHFHLPSPDERRWGHMIACFNSLTMLSRVGHLLDFKTSIHIFSPSDRSLYIVMTITTPTLNPS
jgi:hypothetical protein